MAVKPLAAIQPQPFRFEVTPHVPCSSQVPMRGIAVHSVQHRGLELFGVYPASAPSPVISSSQPRIRMPYNPNTYLSAIGFASGDDESSTCAVLLDLGRVATTSCVRLLGNMLVNPVSDDRGSTSNFALPRRIRVYSLKNYYDPFDTWDLCADIDFLVGLWGWTPVTYVPRTGRYLFLLFGGLARIASFDGIIRRYIHIPRLSVHEHQEFADLSDTVSFAPVTSFATKFDGLSGFWANRGIAAPVAVTHQSIYRDSSAQTNYSTNIGGQQRGLDLLPSSLCGFPVEAPDHPTGSFVSIPHFSSDVTYGGTDFALTIAITEGNCSQIRGCQLMEPLPRRVDNQGEPFLIGRLEIWSTDRDDIVLSSNFSNAGWIQRYSGPIQTLQFSLAAIPYFAYRAIFPEAIEARYLRLIFRTPPNFLAPRRIELSSLSILRDKHFTLLPKAGYDFTASEIRLVLTGATLADDYGLVDGTARFDIQLQISLGGRPWVLLERYRTLLDLRERTRCSLFANARRRAKTEFVESVQGNQAERTWAEFCSDSKTFQQGIIHPIEGTPTRSISRVHVTHGPNQVDVSRGFPAQNYAETILNRPWTSTVGAGFVASASVSTQINGGLTRSQTSGYQNTIENRVADTTVSATRTYVNSRPDPGLSYNSSQSQTQLNRTLGRTEQVPQGTNSLIRGNEVAFDGAPVDIVVASIPINTTLRGNYDGSGTCDRLRVTLGYLPSSIQARCTFRGLAVPSEVDRAT